MATSVSRRLIYVKRTKNPHAPLPRRQVPSNDAMVGERAKPVQPLAPRTPAPVRLSRRAKLARCAALFGGAACLSVAIAALAQSGIVSAKGRLDEPRASAPRIVVQERIPVPVTSAELLGDSLHSVMAQRAAATDDGFRASRYVQSR